MNLALATGHGLPAVGDLEARAPLILAQDVVIVGFRDAEEQAQDGSQPLPARYSRSTSPWSAAGALAAAERAVAHLTRPGAPEHFWVHVDADVLDDAVMPAVDYRQPGGLSPDELATVLAVAVATGRVVGVEVTIYNPALDRSGRRRCAHGRARARLRPPLLTVRRDRIDNWPVPRTSLDTH
jgi:arginase